MWEIGGRAGMGRWLERCRVLEVETNLVASTSWMPQRYCWAGLGTEERCELFCCVCTLQDAFR